MSGVAKWLLGDFGGHDGGKVHSAVALSAEGARRVEEARGLVHGLREYEKTTAATAKATASAVEGLLGQMHLLASRHAETHEALGEGCESILHCLKVNRGEADLLRDGLEVLSAICTPADVRVSLDGSLAEREGGGGGEGSYVQLVNTESLVRSREGVSVVLGLLTEGDFGVVYAAIELLKVLIFNGKVAQLQESMLSRTMGLDSLLGLLNDRRNAVRNEAILLLIALTTGHEEIQKIVGFNNVFERATAIAVEERLNDGSLVVADCLRLLLNLLHDSPLNQSYFRETGCLQVLFPALLILQPSEYWVLSEPKAAILFHSLRLLSVLAAPSSAHAELTANHSVLARCGVLPAVVALSLRRLNCLSVRLQALTTLAALLQGDPGNCGSFYATKVEDNDVKSPQQVPALLRLVTVMLEASEQQEQLVALLAFKAFLLGDENGQMLLAVTFTPLPESADDPSPATSLAKTEQSSLGRILISAGFAWRADLPSRASFASALLGRIFLDNDSTKQYALKTPLALPSPSHPQPPFLLPSLAAAFRDASRQAAPLSVRFGLTLTLCYWLSSFPAAVEQFLATQQLAVADHNVPCVVEAVLQTDPKLACLRSLSALLLGICWLEADPLSPAAHKKALLPLISHRIGLSKYAAALDGLRKSLSFIAAEQQQSPLDSMAATGLSSPSSFFSSHSNASLSTSSSSLSSFDPLCPFVDSEFCEFFKTVYDRILSELRVALPNFHSTPHKPHGRKNSVSNPVSSPFKSQDTSSSSSSSSSTSSTSPSSSPSSSSSRVPTMDSQQLLDRIAELEAECAKLTSESDAERASMESSIQSLAAAYTDLEKHLHAIQQYDSQPPQSTPQALLQQISQLTEENARLTRLYHEERTSKQSASLPEVPEDKSQWEDLIKQQQELYSALEREQEELLVAFAKTEIENNQLKAENQRLKSLLEPKH